MRRKDVSRIMHNAAEGLARKGVLRRRRARLLAVIPAIGLLAFLLPVRSTAQENSELALLQFRALAQSRQPPNTPEISRQRVDETFFQLLAAQGREAAARQSLDRLSGWSKAAATRVATQSSPALDAELLQFSEVRAAVQVAQFEAERRQAQQQANLLLGRNFEMPLTALPSSAPADKSAGSDQELRPPAASSKEDAPWGKLRDRFEDELLPQARELLGKMYQNYLFGGVPLSALLWQEQLVYQTELQYRQVLAKAAMQLPLSE